ncbi:MAG: M23 family metallopeptidase [Desulfarculaceae bacterium]|nr:M23 family metallopeptidase [Desulfarculaceae bacterium]MCF8072339.1 M23 family metallopeptidase [Desulfarculaceae bacterium]MCF8100260.1 M23 family metallopeptidase [Desulfarculaceae bacterium]MCF8116167.1 M23 family metallopeptidase [Desulfarculaceae bacterium]
MARGKSRLWLIILILLLVLAGGGVFYLWPHLEGAPPEISLDKPVTHLGKSQQVFVKVSDSGRGLAWVKVSLVQKERKGVVLNQTFDAPGAPMAALKLAVNPLEMGMRQGPATLVVEARDRSWRNWFRGNQASKEFQVTVDTTPPRLASLSQIIRMNRGGTGLAVYTVDEDQAIHGVRVGDNLFAGWSPWPQRPKTKLCYFAYSDQTPQGANIDLWAQDKAGNKAVLPLNVRLKWKKFRSDVITLNDRFMNKVAARFASLIPSDRQTPLAKFLWVNQDLRKANNARIRAAAQPAQGFQLWEKGLARPLGAPRAGFGDRRTYVLNKEVVSRSVHLGVDLAHTERSPVKAVARGIVRFAGDMGIYGQAVILSHGQGVATLYGHMSQLNVKQGDEVKSGQTVGLSGMTGLALGDHLHFSVLVGGVYVNPTEWWDPHWIKDNILLRFSEAGMPLPTPPAGN